VMGVMSGVFCPQWHNYTVLYLSKVRARIRTAARGLGQTSLAKITIT